MSRPGYLIAFAISPVQAFLREARKAQDIWSGSLILSHLAKHALAILDSRDCTRISPANVENGKPPPPTDRPSVTNEGMVWFSGSEADAVTLAQEVKDSTLECWFKLGRETKERLCPDLFRQDELHLWDKQMKAQFEVFWAVQPLADLQQKHEAAQAVQRLRKSLAAAKRVRQFPPYSGDSRPKCTLSGDWEQMGPGTKETRKFWENTFKERVRTLREGDELRWIVTARIEGSGRERLCAVSLVKRLSPALVLAKRLGFSHHEKPESELRFPSTTAIAWVDVKRQLADLFQSEPDKYRDAVQEFTKAVESYAAATGIPRGVHVLRCHDAILDKLPDQLQTLFRPFLRLDGDWLSVDENRVAVGHYAEEKEELDKKLDRLRKARTALRELCGEDQWSRTPAVAILRADADKLGKLQTDTIDQHGVEKASQLSKFLGETIMPNAAKVIEEDCYGKVIFSGGDEFIALVPAAYALKAADGVAKAYENERFPTLTCSVAVAVINPRSPLRAAVTETTALLDDAKQHRRTEKWHAQDQQPRTRHAFGLAVIPGSGNIKRGVMGLLSSSFDNAGKRVGSRRTIGDVLIPLLDLLTLPNDSPIVVSSKIYRDWIENMDGGEELPTELLPMEADAGIALSEFSRIAERHITIKVEKDQAVPEQTLELLRNWNIESNFADGKKLRKQMVEFLTSCMRSLLEPLVDNPRYWLDVRSLLLGVTTLGTREGNA